jgi:RNA polymerase sigma-70 factor (ECF subfamily)
MALSDAENIKRCREGSTEAFADMVKQYMRLVYVVAYGYVKDEHLANDMAQESFLKAFRSLDKLRKPEQFSAWLMGIVKSVCIDRIRKEKGRGDAVRKNPRPAEVSLESILEGYGSISASPEGDIAAAGSRPSDFNATDNATPLSDLNTHALRQVMLEKMNELPDEYRQLLLLKHIRGVSYENIQKSLRMSYASVVTKLFRARQALKDKLEPVLKHFV